MAAEDKPLSQMSEQELWDSVLLGPPYGPGVSQEPELLGEYSLEEAAAMGAFFEEPGEQEAFEQALAEERARKAAAASARALIC